MRREVIEEQYLTLSDTLLTKAMELLKDANEDNYCHCGGIDYICTYHRIKNIQGEYNELKKKAVPVSQ